MFDKYEKEEKFYNYCNSGIGCFETCRGTEFIDLSNGLGYEFDSHNLQECVGSNSNSDVVNKLNEIRGIYQKRGSKLCIFPLPIELHKYEKTQNIKRIEQIFMGTNITNTVDKLVGWIERKEDIIYNTWNFEDIYVDSDNCKFGIIYYNNLIGGRDLLVRTESYNESEYDLSGNKTIVWSDEKNIEYANGFYMETNDPDIYSPVHLSRKRSMFYESLINGNQKFKVRVHFDREEIEIINTHSPNTKSNVKEVINFITNTWTGKNYY